MLKEKARKRQRVISLSETVRDMIEQDAARDRSVAGRT